jgi:predicted SAM-dependent methyltransferase
LARNEGFYVEAIEMNSDCCSFIRNKVGITVLQANDISAVLQAQNKTYDVIVMWHVIEHLADIWNILELAVTRLNRDGIIALASPNPDSFQFKVMGKYWPHLDTPRHVQLFPMKLLVEKFESLGMTLQVCTTTDEGARHLDRFGWRYLVVRPKSKIKIFQDIKRLIGGLLWRIFIPIDRIEGRGSVYTMVFKK